MIKIHINIWGHLFTVLGKLRKLWGLLYHLSNKLLVYIWTWWSINNSKFLLLKRRRLAFFQYHTKLNWITYENTGYSRMMDKSSSLFLLVRSITFFSIFSLFLGCCERLGPQVLSAFIRYTYIPSNNSANYRDVLC